MKAAVSIPDKLFADAERLVNRFKISRSQLYARALAEFIARHDDDYVTESLNRVYGDRIGEDKFATQSAVKILQSTEWQ